MGKVSEFSEKSNPAGVVRRCRLPHEDFAPAWTSIKVADSPILRFDKAWWSACRAAGIPDRVEKRTLPNGKEITKVTCGRIFHDFRRTAVRNLENAGVPRSQAMRLVGHKTEAIYNRYAISNENDLREAVRKLDAASGD